MRRPPRTVITADVRGRSVALRAVDNGSGFSTSDVGRLVVDAGLELRATASAVFVGLSELPDVEAICEHRNIVLVRTGSRSS